MAALPDIIGQTIGNLVADQLSGRSRRSDKMSPGEQDLIAEAKKSANAVPAADADRFYASQAVADASVSSADVPSGDSSDIVVTGTRFREAVYRPGIDNPLFLSVSAQGKGLASRNDMTKIRSTIGGLSKPVTIMTIEGRTANLAPGETLSPELALILAKASNIDPYNPLFVGGGGEEGTQLTTIVHDYAAGYPVTKGLAEGANFASWAQTDRIRDYIEITRALGLPTALIGHSYGGDAVFNGALYAASRDLSIDYLATIDPVDGSGWMSRHSIAQAQTVKSISGQWIDVRSTTSDSWTSKWGSNGAPDFIENVGGSMTRSVQAVAAPFFYETARWDHAGFVPMFEKYAKNPMIKLYR